MVHFFGIFGPGRLVRNSAEEAPAKANFFGGLARHAEDAVPTRLEQDVCYLSGKAPEPDARPDVARSADGAAER